MVRLIVLAAFCFALVGCNPEPSVTGKDEAPKGAASSEKGVTGGGPQTAPKPDIK